MNSKTYYSGVFIAESFFCKKIWGSALDELVAPLKKGNVLMLFFRR